MIVGKAKRNLMLTAGGAFCLLASPVFASGANQSSGTNDVSSVIAGLGAGALSSTDLAKTRGGSGTVASVNLGSDSGNSASNTVTGSISNAQSVNGNTGLTTVIQNTGNNTLMQSSMTVNIIVN